MGQLISTYIHLHKCQHNPAFYVTRGPTALDLVLLNLQETAESDAIIGWSTRYTASPSTRALDGEIEEPIPRVDFYDTLRCKRSGQTYIIWDSPSG